MTDVMTENSRVSATTEAPRINNGMVANPIALFVSDFYRRDREITDHGVLDALTRAQMLLSNVRVTAASLVLGTVEEDLAPNRELGPITPATVHLARDVTSYRRYDVDPFVTTRDED